jgi:UDP-N-acetylglucosamine 2-epimerase (non-hydrolysing)
LSNDTPLKMDCSASTTTTTEQSGPANLLAERPSSSSSKKIVLTVLGTRPEAIKLGPVIHELELRKDCIRTVNVASGQQTDLIYPVLKLFGIRVDENLQVMRSGQNPSVVCGRILLALDSIVDREKPDMILVQGDTTTALAGALAGFNHRIPVGHVEAGLRSGDFLSPYPEEMNRVLITRLASYHFAATSRNRDLLLSEGVAAERVFLTGNPVVDALQRILAGAKNGSKINRLLQNIQGKKLVVVTTHRRESFGGTMAENLKTLCRFVDDHTDIVLIFPVHPNPNVRIPAREICNGHARVILTDPLNYSDFILLVSHAWLIVSDSGGIQEEAPSLGKPMLVLRKNTERPECIEAGVSRLAGSSPAALANMLEDAYRPGSWIEHVDKVQNPFGAGDSGRLIVQNIAKIFGVEKSYAMAVGM